MLHLVLTTKARRKNGPIRLSRLTGADCRAEGDSLYVLWRPKSYPHRLVIANDTGEAWFDAVLLPLDDAFETRLHAAGRFWRQLNGRPLGPDYGAFPLRSRQLSVLTLRIFDARKAGASYREIASVLLSRAPIEPRDWRDHPLKHRIREYLLKADRMIYRGGYHDLLYYPHRRGRRRGS